MERPCPPCAARHCSLYSFSDALAYDRRSSRAPLRLGLFPRNSSAGSHRIRSSPKISFNPAQCQLAVANGLAAILLAPDESSREKSAESALSLDLRAPPSRREPA